MDQHWRATCILPSNAPSLEDSVRSNRVLRDTSGNVQPYALDSVKGEENTQPGLHHQIAHSPGSKYPPPRVLPSDHQRAVAYRHQARRQHRQHVALRHSARDRGRGFPRAYLNNRKYLEYRARQRRDIGPDGEPVWSDAVEEAFHDGM